MRVAWIENSGEVQSCRIKKFRIGEFRMIERFNGTLFFKNLAHLGARLHHQVIFR